MEKTADRKKGWRRQYLSYLVPGKNGPWKNSPRKNDPREKYLVTGYHLTHVKVNFSQGQFSRAYSAIPFERFFYFYRLIPLFTPRCLTLTPRFFFRDLGLFASFGFVSNIPRTHHDTQCPPHDFLFSSFGFVSNIPRTHHDAQRPPHDFCFRVLGLFRTFHAHTTMLNARPTIFCFRVLGFFWYNFNFNFEYSLKNISCMLVSVISIFTLFSFSLHFRRPFFSSTFLSIGLFFHRLFFPSAFFSRPFFPRLFFPRLFFPRFDNSRTNFQIGTILQLIFSFANKFISNNSFSSYLINQLGEGTLFMCYRFVDFKIC